MNSGHVRQHTQSVRLLSFKPNEEMIKKNTHDARSPMWMKMGKTYLFSNHSLDCETSDTGRSYLAV